NPLHYIDIMGKDLINFHINDRDEKSICLLPGKGRVNYKPIIEKLKTLDYKGPLIIEVYRDNFKTYEELKDVKDFIEKKLLV
ncbi:sugar phosphate isomerase/epimerase family protein, partial [Clostridium perfringens]